MKHDVKKRIRAYNSTKNVLSVAMPKFSKGNFLVLEVMNNFKDVVFNRIQPNCGGRKSLT